MEKTIEKEYKIVKLIWLDTCFYPDQTGTVETILEKARPRIVEDMGWLIGEDEERYVVASAKKEGKRFNKITAVPRNAVKEVVILKDII